MRTSRFVLHKLHRNDNVSNSCLQYKRDTSQLIHWIIQTSNNLPTPLTAPISKSEITLVTLLALSRTIASRVKPIPSAIFLLFESVIAARRSAYSFYLQIVHSDPDPNISESNERHKAFLDALVGAYEAFGGSEWKARREEGLKAGKTLDELEEEVKFVNRFEGLEVAAVNVEESGDEEDGVEMQENVPAAKSKSKANGKAKAKGKKGKGKAKAAKAPEKTPATIPKEHPMESYKLIDGEEGAVDRLMAVYCFLKDFVELRKYGSRLPSATRC